MGKNLKLSKEDQAIFDAFILRAPSIQRIENGKLKYTKMFLKGSIAIKRGITHDNNKQPIDPSKYYSFEKVPVFLDIAKLLKEAWIKGGKAEITKCWESLMKYHKRAEELKSSWRTSS